MKTKRMISVLVAAAAFLLVGATGAQAKVLELTGSTTVTPSEQATKFFTDHGVSVAPVGKATAESGSFVFPIHTGFGNPRTFNGVLAHSGGLKFTKGGRSLVLRRFVAVRHRRHAVLRVRLRSGRVIVLARLTNLAKESAYNGALLSADLKLSRQAARLLNRLAGQPVVSAGAPLGTAQSRVTVVHTD
jgi:hypothetical protein